MVALNQEFILENVLVINNVTISSGGNRGVISVALSGVPVFTSNPSRRECPPLPPNVRGTGYSGSRNLPEIQRRGLG